MPRRVDAESAEMLRRRFAWLRSLSDDELRRISFCEEGDHLHSEEEYFDLSHPERGVFQGKDEETVPEGACFVGRHDVSPETWRDLTKLYGGRTRMEL